MEELCAKLEQGLAYLATSMMSEEAYSEEIKKLIISWKEVINQIITAIEKIKITGVLGYIDAKIEALIGKIA